MQTITVHASQAYPIWISHGLLAECGTLVRQQTKAQTAVVVTDDTVNGFYGDTVTASLEQSGFRVLKFVFPHGEASKCSKTLNEIYDFLCGNNLTRTDCLVALGGGVVGDITGFAAATYLRGIDFVQVPTTLLSQVDSSIGGKTGVDFDAYKNMVGAFHMPKLVYMNLGTLNTLSERQFACGMGEIIKHGLIQDKEYFTWLKENSKPVMDRTYEALLHMVEGSCRIKRHVVEEDPTEKGIRAWLNYGHTVGHAIEKLKNFKLCHGECVAIGSVAAAYLSVKRGLLTEAEAEDIRETLQLYGLPVCTDGLFAEDVLKTTKLDKKMDGGHIKFVLLKHIGEAAVHKDVEDAELLEAIRYVLEGEAHE